MPQETILITGAAGGIGSTARAAIDILLKQGHRVRAMVRKLDARAELASYISCAWGWVQAGQREPRRAWESETEIRWREPLVAPCDGYRERGLHALPTPASSFPWTWERAWGDEGCARIFWRTRDS